MIEALAPRTGNARALPFHEPESGQASDMPLPRGMAMVSSGEQKRQLLASVTVPSQVPLPVQSDH
eukprot:3841720-Rhodomonas_salina.1